MERRLTAILHADIVGYSRLLETDEDSAIRQVRADLTSRWKPSIESHGGRLINAAGDAVLAVFGAVADAVACGVAFQTTILSERRNGDDTDGLWRVGVNLGDVSFATVDAYGMGINVAARIQALADPGGICISRPVWESLPGEARRAFGDDGPRSVRNIALPIHIYRWRRPGQSVDTSAPTRTSQRKMIVLEGRDPADRPYRLRIDLEALGSTAAGLIVGRQTAGCDYAVAHDSISRRHARLVVQGAILFIEDLGSTNGTVVGGVRQSPGKQVPLTPGQQLSIGDVVFTVSAETEAA